MNEKRNNEEDLENVREVHSNDDKGYFVECSDYPDWPDEEFILEAAKEAGRQPARELNLGSRSKSGRERY